MRNATIERRRFVTRDPGVGRRAGIILGALAIAVAAVVGANLAHEPIVGTNETASLSTAQQAEADRLTGLAEHHSFASIRKAQAAEAARWQAMGELYQRNRARESEIDRLNKLAEYFGLTGLTRSQQAEADRLTRWAEYRGVAP
jgi:hypothetical protein